MILNLTHNILDSLTNWNCIKGDIQICLSCVSHFDWQAPLFRIFFLCAGLSTPLLGGLGDQTRALWIYMSYSALILSIEVYIEDWNTVKVNCFFWEGKGHLVILNMKLYKSIAIHNAGPNFCISFHALVVMVCTCIISLSASFISFLFSSPFFTVSQGRLHCIEIHNLIAWMI